MKLFYSEKGQGLTEYAIVLSLVAVAAIASTALFGGAIKSKVAAITGAIAGQDQAAVNAADAKSKSAAKQADEVASQVHGMGIEHGGNNAAAGVDVIDKVNLSK